MNDSFSIVTPNYNMGCYLKETIESVLQNLRTGDEYFIVDGGSTDESVEIIRSYEKHLTGWISERDKGYADALSKGFKRSNGAFQCWINSGDLLLKGTLDKAREMLIRTGADMVFGDDLYIDEHGCVIKHSSGSVRSLKKMMLHGGWTPLQDACYWRKSLYDHIGGIYPNMRYAADYALFLRMSCTGHCEYVPIVFSAFRKHYGQKSIAGESSYRQERETFRKYILCNEKLPLVKRVWLSLAYHTNTKWRVHISKHLRKSYIPIGASVSNLEAKEIKAIEDVQWQKG